MSRCMQLSFGRKRGNERLMGRALPVPEKEVGRENKRHRTENGSVNGVRMKSLILPDNV